MALTNSGAVWTEHKSVAQPASVGRITALPPVPDDFLFEWDVGDDLAALGVVFTGGANRTYRDGNGVIQTAALNTPRDAHYVLNPVTGVYERSWLLEPARTNVLKQSVTLAAGPWNRAGNITVALNTGAAPDGTNTATRLVQGTSVADNYVYQSYAVTAGQPITASWYARPAGVDWVKVSFESSVGAGTAYVNANVATGTQGTVNVNGTGLTMRVESLAGGWRRFMVTLTPTMTDADAAFVFRIEQTNNSPWWAGNGVLGVDVWGFQIENGAFASTYIPTTTAAATRVTETAYVPWAVAPGAMTVYPKFIDLGSINTANAEILRFGNAGAPQFSLVAPAGKYRISFSDGVVGGTSATVALASAIGSLVELLATAANDGAGNVALSLQQTLNNVTGTPVSVTNVGAHLPTEWPGARLYVGGDGVILPQGFAAFQRLAIARGAPSLDQMRGVADLPLVTKHYELGGSGTNTGSFTTLDPDHPDWMELTPDDSSGDGTFLFLNGVGRVLGGQ